MYVSLWEIEKDPFSATVITFRWLICSFQSLFQSAVVLLYQHTWDLEWMEIKSHWLCQLKDPTFDPQAQQCFPFNSCLLFWFETPEKIEAFFCQSPPWVEKCSTLCHRINCVIITLHCKHILLQFSTTLILLKALIWIQIFRIWSLLSPVVPSFVLISSKQIVYLSLQESKVPYNPRTLQL